MSKQLNNLSDLADMLPYKNEYVKGLEKKLEDIADIIVQLDEGEIGAEEALDSIGTIAFPGRDGN